VLKKFGLAQRSRFVLLVSGFGSSILMGQSTQGAPASPDTSTGTPAVAAPAPYVTIQFECRTGLWRFTGPFGELNRSASSPWNRARSSALATAL
jgi:hypothetical protein